MSCLRVLEADGAGAPPEPRPSDAPLCICERNSGSAGGELGDFDLGAQLDLAQDPIERGAGSGAATAKPTPAGRRRAGEAASAAGALRPWMRMSDAFWSEALRLRKRGRKFRRYG